MLMATKVAHIIGIILVLTMLNCCDENEQIRVVPYTSVNLTMNLSLPQFNPLMYSNNAILVSGFGYNNNGIIVYRLIDDFYAYDATCPQHIETSTAVQLDGVASGTATCPECGARYILMTGFSTNSEDIYPLQPYNASGVGNTVYVNN